MSTEGPMSRAMLRPVESDEARAPREATDLSRARKRLMEAKALIAGGEFDRASGQILKAYALAPEDGATLAAAAAMYLNLSQAMFRRAQAFDPAVQESKAARKLAKGATDTFEQDLSTLERRLENAPSTTTRARQVSPAPWPNRSIVWKDLDRVFRRYVLAETPPEPGLLTASSRVLTMGSCFAENISRRLATHGVKVRYQRIREELNTTFANERIVRWAVEGPSAPDGEAIEAHLGAETRAEFRAALADCDVYVYSLGVAPAVFDSNGQYVLALADEAKKALADGGFARTTSPSENAGKVLDIIGLLRALNPNVQVFLTLSPVPLAGSAERASAILADCVSKSSLRLAVEEVMAAEQPGVRYWPSFEMAKWWGAHLVDKNAFAADGESRHVSPWLIAKIMDLFVEYYGDASFSTAPSSEAPESPEI